MSDEKVVTITDFSALDTGPGGIPNSYLKDGDHHFCFCHNCKIQLCDVWVTQPKLKVKSKIVAKCPKCGDTSLEVQVTGKFHLGSTDKCDIADMKYSYGDGSDGYINQKLTVISKLK